VKVVVWGLLANSPFGGMTWQVLHHLEGLQRLGLDVWYVEDNDTPHMADGGVAWARRALASIGMADRFIMRVPATEEVIGATAEQLARLYREAGAVFNLCGSHWVLDGRHDEIETLVLLETDPVSSQVHLAGGDPLLREQVERYAQRFTYGQNIGDADCPVPTCGVDWIPTRPPVVVDWWANGAGRVGTGAMTTIATWGDHGAGKDVAIGAATYRWRKDVAFAPYLDLPRRTRLPLELALARAGEDELEDLAARGWRLRQAAAFDEPHAYRAYVHASLGEFTAVKEQYVGTRSGWMSDRSVCYLAAGRPVVTESTGAERHVPAGEGLLTFADAEQAAAALEDVAADPLRHGAAARELAHEYFAAERVLGDIVAKVGLG